MKSLLTLDKFHAWLDDHETIKFLFVLVLSTIPAFATMAFVHPIVGTIMLMVMGYVAFTRWAYLRR